MYSSITIIYNPKSTGDAPDMARDLEERLQAATKGVPISLKETEYAGHAEKLAYESAQHGAEPLVISVSGDGGYNEVVNGVMRANEEGGNSICAVLPAGNANDHRRAVKKRPLLEGILAHDVSRLDLLEVASPKKRRFAHSYVGLGLSPAVAVELNRNKLNTIRELLLVVKTYWQYQPFAIKVGGAQMELDSLVLANIPEMAKVLELSEDGTPTDGRFEIVAVPHRNKLHVVAWALKAATVGLGKQPQASSYGFTAVSEMPMQLDGEIVALAAGEKVTVSSAKQVLATIR